jgi:hypothetical protein
LADRDRELEHQRAEQFVRVLDDVLSRGGVSGRRLRDRVRQGIEALPLTPAPAEALPPEPPPPAKGSAKAARPRRPAKAAAAKKTAAVETAAEPPVEETAP